MWAHKFEGKKVQILCDNQATVEVVNSGKCRNPIMLRCARELAYVAATNNFLVRCVHLPGESNRICDSLSRWHLSQKYQGRFWEEVRGQKVAEVDARLQDYQDKLDARNADLEEALQCTNRKDPRRRHYLYTSENVLRILVCQVLEGESLRGIVVRIDDSECLRRFVRIHDGPMMDFTTLCNLKNTIRPETWEAINRHLARLAVRQERIKGDKLRLDTTAVETNVHYPTDSSLLWDTYRSFARSIASSSTSSTTSQPP